MPDTIVTIPNSIWDLPNNRDVWTADEQSTFNAWFDALSAEDADAIEFHEPLASALKLAFTERSVKAS